MLFGVPERSRLEEAYGENNPVWKAVGPLLGWVSRLFVLVPLSAYRNVLMLLLVVVSAVHVSLATKSALKLLFAPLYFDETTR